MAIVSSVIASANTQIDGRIAVVEVHTDNIGLTYDHLYIAAATDNLTTNLNNYAVTLAAQIVVNEVSANLANIEAIGATAITATNYTTPNQTINAALSAFAGSSTVSCLNISAWLNTLSFAQLASANSTKFPNVTSFNNWKASFVTPAVNANTTVNALVGG